jgi:hypothetical protein
VRLDRMEGRPTTTPPAARGVGSAIRHPAHAAAPILSAAERVRRGRPELRSR